MNMMNVKSKIKNDKITVRNTETQVDVFMAKNHSLDQPVWKSFESSKMNEMKREEKKR